jgi:MFS family permease
LSSRQPLASAPFRWLCASSLLASTASGIERTTTAWLALELGGAFEVGLVLAARMLPPLLFGLAAGTIADRHNRVRQLWLVSAATAPILLGLAWLAASGSVAVWSLSLLSFGLGCWSVFDTPARQALVLDAVGRQAAASGLAQNALATRLAFAGGAFAAGALIPLLGVSPAYLICAAGYLLAALLVSRVRLAQRQHWQSASSFSRALTDGVRLLIDYPAVRTLSAVGILCEVFAFSYQSAVPAFARDVLQTGSEGLGTLNAAASIGGTCAVVLLAMVPAGVRREPLLALVFLVFGISLVALAPTRAIGLAALTLGVTGACGASFDLLQQTLLQLSVPEERRGRALGIWLLGLGSAPIGLIEMGALAAALGAPLALGLNGAIVTVSACGLIALVPGYRWWDSRAVARSMATLHNPPGSST